MLLKKNSFKTRNGYRLATYYKNSVESSNRAILMFHGYAEYTDRYRAFIDRLSKEGFHVFAIDHVGHGRSDGKHGYIRSYRDLIGDASEWVESLMESNPDYDWYVFGHSMGGGVAIQVVSELQPEIKAMVLSGPLIMLPEIVPAAIAMLGRMIAAIWPTLPVVPIDVDLMSRDPEVIKVFREDPNSYVGKVRARTAVEIEKLALSTQRKVSMIDTPFWVGHGSLDRLTDPSGSRLLYENALTPDKELKIYPGLFHEIINEPEGQVVIHDICQWLKKR